jgi:hypothetical protein
MAMTFTLKLRDEQSVPGAIEKLANLANVQCLSHRLVKIIAGAGDLDSQVRGVAIVEDDLLTDHSRKGQHERGEKQLL